MLAVLISSKVPFTVGDIILVISKNSEEIGDAIQARGGNFKKRDIH